MHVNSAASSSSSSTLAASVSREWERIVDRGTCKRGRAVAGVEERKAEQNLAWAFVAVHANATFCSAPLSLSPSTLPSPCSSSLACGNGSQPEQAEAVAVAVASSRRGGDGAAQADEQVWIVILVVAVVVVGTFAFCSLRLLLLLLLSLLQLQLCAVSSPCLLCSVFTSPLLQPSPFHPPTLRQSNPTQTERRLHSTSVVAACLCLLPPTATRRSHLPTSSYSCHAPLCLHLLPTLLHYALLSLSLSSFSLPFAFQLVPGPQNIQRFLYPRKVGLFCGLFQLMPEC